MNYFVDFRRTLLDVMGSESDWEVWLDRAIGHDEEHGRRFEDMPAIICECLFGEELRAAFSHMLSTHTGARFRQSTPKLRRSKGSPDQIAATLAEDEIRQFLLLFTNHDLVGAIDYLIQSKKIEIPPAEIRTTDGRQLEVPVNDKQNSRSNDN
jgi:hypothetical protein